MSYIIAFALLLAFTSLAAAYIVWRSPYGYEDEDGFHFGGKDD